MSGQHNTSDPSYISSMEHFESMPHEEIYRKAQQINPSALAAGALTWLEVAATLTAGFPAATAVLTGVLEAERWSGAAAEAALRSAKSIAASAEQFAEAMESISARLAAVAAAGEAVKLGVAPPGDKGPVAILTSLVSGASLMDNQRMAEELRREAVMVMNTVYIPCYRPAGEGVPAFPEDPEPVHIHAASPRRRSTAPAEVAPAAVTDPSPGASVPAPAQQTGGPALSASEPLQPGVGIQVQVGPAPRSWPKEYPEGQAGVTFVPPGLDPDKYQAGVIAPEE